MVHFFSLYKFFHCLKNHHQPTNTVKSPPTTLVLTSCGHHIYPPTSGDNVQLAVPSITGNHSFIFHYGSALGEGWERRIKYRNKECVSDDPISHRRRYFWSRLFIVKEMTKSAAPTPRPLTSHRWYVSLD